MSFSKDVKNEILSKSIKQDNHCLAFLSGLFKSSAYIEDEEKLNFYITTDVENLCNFVNAITKKLYKQEAIIEVKKGYQIKKEDYYKISFDDKTSKQVLKDTDCVVEQNGTLIKDFDVHEEKITDEKSLTYFVAGVFVGCGTSSIKINRKDRMSTGYHLEFASKSSEFLTSIQNILKQFEIYAKLIKRRNLFILYVKDANEVSNVLALVGAFNAVFSLQNEMATREIRNKVNRQTNCMSANINKTVNASIKQNDAISYIIMKVGLEDLPQDLQNVALLRMANPEESLDELVKLATFEITKSGLNYRLNKIIKIANRLQKEQ